MPSSPPTGIAIIGGGIVGVATAMSLTKQGAGSVVVLEAEEKLAAHQTGHNSGVIHSGLYYRPGSSKARNCTAGREAMYRFCEEHGIAHERCGKVVVATRGDQLPALDELERRGTANGLVGLQRLAAGEIADYEPHARGVAGLYVPDTGIVDYTAVTEAMSRLVTAAGGEVRTDARVIACQRKDGGLVLETTAGTVRARAVVNCAGLQSDRVARLCGVEPGLRIVPFRGAYCELVPERAHLVRNLLYPVPDPRFPFLGVHFTRMIHGGSEVGPNAVLALKRGGYGQFAFDPRDTVDALSYGGSWRMFARHWRTGLGEVWRQAWLPAMVKALQALVPEVQTADLRRAGSGVRAQAVAPDGRPVDDFHIVEAARMVHVLNAPSPAATAAIRIGEVIAGKAVERAAGR